MARRRGFTLIELLVVIAIIGILAAMVFPVFARARESARKVVCLSNVKNIALAVQMYLNDYDGLWPRETRAEVNEFAHPANPTATNPCALQAGTKMNPYLEQIVILDEYVRNRDVWVCPSAPVSRGKSILNPYGGDWWTAALAYPTDQWGVLGIGQCGGGPYPPGWGGDVTDSAMQQGARGVGPGGFRNTIHVIELRGVKASQIDDPVMYVIGGDSPAGGTDIWGPLEIAYPDAAAMCGATPGKVACCGGNWVDWENCPETQACGASSSLNYADPEVRKEYGRARHLGGSNVAFADGHAKWYRSEDILANYAPIDGVNDKSSWRYECYSAYPGAGAQWMGRDTWGGFSGGICGFWGAFGFSADGCG